MTRRNLDIEELNPRHTLRGEVKALYAGSASVAFGLAFIWWWLSP